MGYAGPFQLGLDEPGWRNDPFSQPGIGDDCTLQLNRWLSECEWAPSSSYLQLETSTGDPPPRAAQRVGRPSVPGGWELEDAIQRAVKGERARGFDATADVVELKAQQLANAEHALQQHPPVRELVTLPTSIRARYDTDAMHTGRLWDQRHPEQGNVGANLDTGSKRSSKGEASKPMSADGERCWRNMNSWLHRCVLTPM